MQPHLMFSAATVADWYWLANDGRVYSSKRFATVPKTDADYQAWLATGFATSTWPPDATGAQTDAALDEVLSSYGASRDRTGTLRAAAAAARYACEVGGITVGGVKVATDRDSQSMITGAYVKASRDGTFKTPWKGSDGSFTVLDAPTILALGDAVTAHVASCFAVEAQVDSDIAAGNITTPAQIEAAFAAVTA